MPAYAQVGMCGRVALIFSGTYTSAEWDMATKAPLLPASQQVVCFYTEINL